MSASGLTVGPTTATLVVSTWAPPMPSICRESGEPTMRKMRSSRRAGSVGKSSQRKQAPLDVPPRIIMHGTPSLTGPVCPRCDPLAKGRRGSVLGPRSVSESLAWPV